MSAEQGINSSSGSNADIAASSTLYYSIAGRPTIRLTGNNIVIIRDFAYPDTHPLYSGIYPVQSPTPSTTSDIDNLFPCMARALYDFEAEADTELSFREGTVMEVQDRKYPGWLSAVVDGKRGLVPENYVAIEDTDDQEGKRHGRTP